MGKVGGTEQSAYHAIPRKRRCGARPSAGQRARRQAMARTGELCDGLGLLVARFRRPHLVALWRGSHRSLDLLAREKGSHRAAASLWPKCPVGCFTSVWWLQKVGKPQGRALPPPEGGRPSPEGGGHLGHVFWGQGVNPFLSNSHLRSEFAQLQASPPSS